MSCLYGNQAYTARIREVNSRLNPVLEINPQAMTIAEQLDLERQQGTTRGYVRIALLLLDAAS